MGRRELRGGAGQLAGWGWEVRLEREGGIMAWGKR